MSLTLLPAIDLIDGHAVRLRQGEYSDKTVYSNSPVEVAREFEKAGAVWLHVVDLDGAKTGHPVNHEVVHEIVRKTKLSVEIGGGIGQAEHWRRYLEMGVARVILGSVAIKHPERLSAAALEFPGRVVLGLDARGGMVSTEGWTETSTTPAAEVLRRFASLPLAAVVYTDIGRDGMLSGPNLEETLALARISPFPVVVSGGVSSLDDVRAVAAAAKDEPGIAGLIVGKALYEGRISISEALMVLSA